MDYSTKFFSLFFIFCSFVWISKAGVTDSTLVVGSTVELKCQYHANSTHELNWLKVKPDTSVQYSFNKTIFLSDNPDIKRRVTITGNHNLGEYHLSISNVTKSDAGTYQCVVGGNLENKNLTVLEGPSSVSIGNQSQHNNLRETEDHNMKISCSAVGGDPAPDMVLQIKNKNYTSTSSSRTIQQTIFAVDRSYDLSTVICLAGFQSISYFPKLDTATIYLFLKPLSPLFSPDTVSTEETKSLSVSCTSSGGRPKPTVKWSINNVDINPLHSTDQSSHDTATDTYTVTSSLVYSVDRSDNGSILSCGFKNTATGDSYVSQTRTIDVKYPPSVSVENKTYNPGDISRQITCNANGNPDTYTFSKWQHRSKYGDKIRHLEGNSTLILPEVQEKIRYQDTGEYVCTVSNDIKDKDGNVNQHASGYVVSRAPPIFLSGEHQSILGQTNNDVEIKVNVYSEPKYTSLTWLKDRHTILPSSKYDMVDVPAAMKDTFHRKEVQVDGFIMTLTVHNLQEDDFVNYTLRLWNGVGQKVEHLIVLSSASPPEIPINFTKIGATESTITLQWLAAYDGGDRQFFIVEYRTIGSSNWGKATVPITLHASKGDLQIYTLSGLQDGTSYEIRVYAQNQFNRSNATDIVTVSTTESSGQGPIIGAVVGVLTVVVVIIVIIVAVMIARRKRDDNGAKKRLKTESEGEEGLKDNILYKSVDTGSKTPVAGEYTEVQKPNDVYAEVNKPEPQKNKNDKKPKEPKSPRKKKQKQKAMNNKSAAEEYANQSEYANAGNPIDGYTNADGLQYADLTFSNPPKTKTGKSVIHGLDERTIYCDVVHTKKAPPPPQEGAYELTEINQGKQS